MWVERGKGEIMFSPLVRQKHHIVLQETEAGFRFGPSRENLSWRIHLKYFIGFEGSGRLSRVHEKRPADTSFRFFLQET